MQRFGFALGLMLLSGCSDASAPPGAMCTGLSDSKMVWVSGGSFVMGDGPQYDEEGPPQTVTVQGFWICLLYTSDAADE